MRVVRSLLVMTLVAILGMVAKPASATASVVVVAAAKGHAARAHRIHHPSPPTARRAQSARGRAWGGRRSEATPRGGISDPIGQLLAMVPDQAKTELFRFDSRGNIHEDDPGGPLRVYSKGNRLLRKGDMLSDNYISP